MCVIIVSERSRPSLDLLIAAERANPDGAGLAWREGGVVRYAKGLTASQVFEMQKEIPLPFVSHFRLATEGGVSPELCHPFPISEEVPVSLAGTADAVLFHNGIFLDWKSLCLKAVVSTGRRFIEPPYSDTRAITWMVSIYGETILNLIENQRVVVFKSNSIDIYGEGWRRYGEHLLSSHVVIGKNFLDNSRKKKEDWTWRE